MNMEAEEHGSMGERVGRLTTRGVIDSSSIYCESLFKLYNTSRISSAINCNAADSTRIRRILNTEDWPTEVLYADVRWYVQ